MDSCFPQRLPLRRLEEPEKKRTQWALTQEEMKNCLWLKPKLVAQIEFAEWTPDGRPDLSLRPLRGNLPRTDPNRTSALQLGQSMATMRGT